MLELLRESAPSRPSAVISKSITSLVLAVLTIVTLAAFMYAQDETDAQDTTTVTTILSFGTMIGDPGTGTPAAKAKNVIRGYSGPPSPWLIRSAHGTLKTNGSLTVTVRGLVLPNGTNPVPFFRAALSCQDPINSTKGRLFFTKTFPADVKGNSNITGTVRLPAECIAPIILVTSPSVAGNPDGFWFSVTGR